MGLQRISKATLLLAIALCIAAPGVAWARQVQRVRVGGAIKEPTKIKDVKPEYPEIARAAGIQGIVIIETVIGTDGSVIEARVLRPVPMLESAAIDAVRQWKFTETLLNGQPVEVVMTVTVTFSLMSGQMPPARSEDTVALIERARQSSKSDELTALLDRALEVAKRERTLVSPEIAASTAPADPNAAPVRVGGNIREPRKIKDVKPVYPAEAVAKRLSGIVIMEIIIDVDGNVSAAKVLRAALPEFEDAAVAAVRQWKFEPTMLNGVRVPVIMTVTVTFTTN